MALTHDRDSTTPAPSGEDGCDGGLAADAPTGWRRRATSALLAVVLFVMGVSGLPRYVEAQDTVLEWTDPVITGCGLWQIRWELFGPSPDDTNAAITAVAHFADGETATWRSPDWRALSPLGKLRWFRHAEYTDAVRRDDYWDAWTPLADHLARTLAHPTDPALRPVRVELVRHWLYIPEPTEPLRPFEDPHPYDDSYVFHVEEYGE